MVIDPLSDDVEEQGLMRYGGDPSELVPRWGALPIPKNAIDFAQAEHDTRIIDGRGWPMRSMWLEYEMASDGVLWDASGALVGIDLGWRHKSDWLPVALPVRPIWNGFIANTILYGVLLWLVATGAVALRRVIRRTRGHCPHCGYNLRASLSEGCPECGCGRKPSDATPGPEGT